MLACIVSCVRVLFVGTVARLVEFVKNTFEDKAKVDKRVRFDY